MQTAKSFGAASSRRAVSLDRGDVLGRERRGGDEAGGDEVEAFGGGPAQRLGSQRQMPPGCSKTGGDAIPLNSLNPI